MTTHPDPVTTRPDPDMSDLLIGIPAFGHNDADMSDLLIRLPAFGRNGHGHVRVVVGVNATAAWSGPLAPGKVALPLVAKDTGRRRSSVDPRLLDPLQRAQR